MSKTFLGKTEEQWAAEDRAHWMKRPPGHGPKVIQVIESEVIRGNGKTTIMRAVKQYHTLDGDLLAENDPRPDGKIDAAS